ncbi:histidine phosphatase superfamily [Ochromonadaceae sp. CCMP2298]|nr:histidine phosphatase superfamily [Ochromonadaceae sp. CCMP2298]
MGAAAARHDNRLALIPLAFILSVLLMYWRLEKPAPVTTEDGGYVQMAHSPPVGPPLERYCHTEVPRRFYFAHSSSNWTLEYLAINIRHGDRSSIHDITGAKLPTPPARPPLIDGRALSYMPLLASFSLHPLRHYSSAPALVEGNDMARILDPQGIMRSADRDLGPGQLTSRGYMQHISLGQQLRAVYAQSGFLRLEPQQIYIRSTSYARTIQSVAALLTAMLLDPAPTSPTSTSASALRGSVTTSLTPIGPGALPIHFYASEADEIMHGVLRRSPLTHSNDAAGQKEGEYSEGCHAAFTLGRGQLKAIEVPAPLVESMQSTLGSGVQGMVSRWWRVGSG